MIIGGQSIHKSPSPNFISTKVYADETVTWCTRSSNRSPKWKDLLRLFDDRTVVMTAVLVYNAVTILGYLQGYFENWNHDICTMYLKAFQLIINSPPNLQITNDTTRILIAMQCFCSLWINITIMSIYIMLLSRTFDEHQISTRNELIENDFQLAGNDRSLDLIQNIGQMVWARG